MKFPAKIELYDLFLLQNIASLSDYSSILYKCMYNKQVIYKVNFM